LKPCSRACCDHGYAAGEPVDHALGRSRGGLTTKIHLAAARLRSSLPCDAADRLAAETVRHRRQDEEQAPAL